MNQMARRVRLTEAGGPEVLQVETVPVPAPGTEQLVIAMEAAGVAFGDTTIRAGRNPGKLPTVPGYDVVGRISAIGPDVAGFAVGERVAALCMTGGYATHVVVESSAAVPVPDDLEAADVAALTLNYLTAWQMLHRAAKVGSGQSILVLGAAGGIGSALTELAALSDVRVFGTASAKRHEVLRSRGVTVVADQEAVTERLDAVFDSIGGPSLRRSRRATEKDGVVVAYGFSFTVDAGASRATGLVRTLLAIGRAKLTPGPKLVLFMVGKDAAETRADLTRLIDLLAHGKLHPVVATLPLAEVATAHRRLEARQVVGKLVLVP
jgi:NADPH:quinone reductase-like Zn-dependent oxidoreductase